MGRFKKKPVVVDAFLWGGAPPQEGYPLWLDDAFRLGAARVLEPESFRGAPLRISTLEGIMFASPGDWIIRGVKGEIYPCKPDIFEATYDPIIEDPCMEARLRSMEKRVLP